MLRFIYIAKLWVHILSFPRIVSYQSEVAFQFSQTENLFGILLKITLFHKFILLKVITISSFSLLPLGFISAFDYKSINYYLEHQDFIRIFVGTN